MDEPKKRFDNIDEQGNVLYLDEERLKRKEIGYPPYKNKSNGLGIKNWLLEHVIYMNKKRWPLTGRLYNLFIRYSAWMKQGGWKARIYKRGILLAPDGKKHTGTVIIPLNVDVTDKGEKVVVPLEFIKESLKKVSYIAGMNSCLCREANECKEYPHNLGCLFLGEAAKIVVKHELGHEFTYEEACARVDDAAKLGLMGQAVWLEVEQALWGIRNDLMDHLMEICFCCPCCCISMRIARNATDGERHRFHPAGWTAVPNRTKCTGCQKCANAVHSCPVEALSFGEDRKVIINQEKCVGCGICASRCDYGAIQIKQTMPMRKDFQEYFRKEYNLDLKL